MKKLLLLTTVFILFCALVPAQTKKFRWESEMCLFEGTYDPSAATEAQLKNTYRMWTSAEFEMDIVDAAVFKYENIKKLRTPQSLDEEYASKSTALKTLEIVNAPFWKAFKERKLKELEESYQLARVSVQAYQNPSALRELKYAATCVSKYAGPLISGGGDLLGLWRQLNEERRKLNGDPERVRREFEAQLSSEDKFKYAQVYVITFGWWNCVNDLIDRGPNYAEVEKNYQKLFKRVKTVSCEEP